MGQMRARQHDQVSSAGAYWNIGHNFRFERAAEVIAETWSSRSFLFLHDVIPLLYPETQREVSRLHFLRFCQWTTKLDAQLIVSSQSTVAEIERLEGAGFALFGRQINSVIQMPLPVESRFFDTKHAPHRPISEVPFFLIIGTWEKRKNLNILLDVWEQLASERGKKIVLKWVGKRDGMSRKAIARLERLKRDGWIEELGGVSDQTIKELFADARALLFPSLAEGWGLPLAEALAAGLPVIASDLPICREVSQGLAEYQNPSDCSQWIVSVKEFAGLDSSLRLAQLERVQSYQLQLWEAYFDQLADRLKP
jgi:glycosyltransferase involved in cell wall biosynthesis